MKKVSTLESTQSNTTVVYGGGQIDREMLIVENDTGQVIGKYNTILVSEKPRKIPTKKKDRFAKNFLQNKQHVLNLVKENKLTQYDISILWILEQCISWESNIICDLESMQYLNSSDLSKKYNLGKNNLNKTLNKLNHLGIICFVNINNSKQRYIVLNPYLSYQGSKIDYSVLVLFDSVFLKLEKINFEKKMYLVGNVLSLAPQAVITE